jgi:hypothetical protein
MSLLLPLIFPLPSEDIWRGKKVPRLRRKQQNISKTISILRYVFTTSFAIELLMI